jgi:GntR family transcriptional regulator, arabinose operon transcriptional repressor
MSSPVPLYEQVRAALGAEVVAGGHDPSRPFITEREVCRRFGVSSITATRALNELVADGLLVRRRGLGTFVADRPRRTEPGTIACIVHGLHGLQGAHLADLLGGVEAACADLGHQLVLLNSRGSPEREAASLLQAIERRADGIVIYPVEGRSHRKAFETVRRRGVPLVMVDRYRPDIASDSVTADNTQLGQILTARLIELGHRRIALLWGETDCTSVTDRLAGHLGALRDHDIPLRPDLTVLRTYEPLPQAERRARLAALLDGPEPPTALVCGNGYVLATVVHDLAVLGVDVPGGIDLACMDDAGPYDLLPLTAVAGRLPSEAMGRTSVKVLADRLAEEGAGRDPHRRLVLPAELVDRESAAGHLGVVSAARGA